MRVAERWIQPHEPTSRRCLHGIVRHCSLKVPRPQSTSDAFSSSWTNPAAAATTARRFLSISSHPNPLPLTKREFADLEERIHRASGSVADPVLGQSLESLQWLHRRLAVSSQEAGTTILRMLVKVPTLLHPGLPDLKRRIQEAAEAELKKSSGAIGQSLTVDVEAIATRPVPYVARWMGEHDEQEAFLRELGPGLANVSHIVAVYSCKVRSVSGCRSDARTKLILQDSVQFASRAGSASPRSP